MQKSWLGTVVRGSCFWYWVYWWVLLNLNVSAPLAYNDSCDPPPPLSDPSALFISYLCLRLVFFIVFSLELSWFCYARALNLQQSPGSKKVRPARWWDEPFGTRRWDRARDTVVFLMTFSNLDSPRGSCSLTMSSESLCKLYYTLNYIWYWIIRISQSLMLTIVSIARVNPLDENECLVVGIWKTIFAVHTN